MSPEHFKAWLSEMKARYKGVDSDNDCAKLLGVSANSIVDMKKRGTDHRTDLACRTLLPVITPFGGEK